jgi:putative membrane protein
LRSNANVDATVSEWVFLNMQQNKARHLADMPDQARLALERTYLAHERTLMAWVRTGTALVTFGIALYKFFPDWQGQNLEQPESSILGPRQLGISMIAIGVITLLLATWQHRQSMRRLRLHYPDIPFSIALILAVMMSCLGALALIAPLFRQ